MLFHDESTLYAAEGQSMAWTKVALDGSIEQLRKKGMGKSFMISGFLDPNTGRLLRRKEVGCERIPLYEPFVAFASDAPAAPAALLPAAPAAPPQSAPVVDLNVCRACGNNKGRRGMISCDICTQWFHCKCVKMTQQAATLAKVWHCNGYVMALSSLFSFMF